MEDHEEIIELLDVVNSLSVAKKYVLLITSIFDEKKIVNITINFQVTVHHKQTGKKHMILTWRPEARVSGL